MEDRPRLVDKIREELVGQSDAIDAILPYVDIWNAGLHSGERPIGNFLLLGPSGSGKTKTVEALAYALHGSDRFLLRVDCGEYQLDHEIARLIGCFAPDTQVLVDGGRTVAIQDVKAGDWVVSKTGNLRRVLDTHAYSHDGDMVRLWVSNSGIPLNCTPDHKILAIRVGYSGRRLRNPSLLYNPAKLGWVPARDLRKNDIVVHPRFTAMLPNGGWFIDVSLPLGPSGTRRMAHVDADYVYSRVTGVETFQYRGNVYDLSVDEDTSYVANLITVSNSPPGYLGHRETAPVLQQQKLNAVTSRDSDISLVLFDEIEKAAPSLTRLLLGVLDKGTLKLGDNTTVNFCSSMIFLTSNLGARQMSDMLTERYGFKSERAVTKTQLMRAGMVAVRKRFSPEFINRLDKVVAYEPLKDEEYRKILSIQMEKLQGLVDRRMADETYRVCLTEEGKAWVLERGCSKEYGAREMKRVLHREVVAKLARIRPRAGSVVRFGVRGGELVAMEAAT